MPLSHTKINYANEIVYFTTFDMTNITQTYGEHIVSCDKKCLSCILIYGGCEHYNTSPCQYTEKTMLGSMV